MRNQKTGSKYKQLTDVNAVVQQIESEFDTTIGLFINHKLHSALDELREKAAHELKELV